MIVNDCIATTVVVMDFAVPPPLVMFIETSELKTAMTAAHGSKYICSDVDSKTMDKLKLK